MFSVCLAEIVNPTRQLQKINKHRKAAGLVSKHTMSHYSPKKRKTTKETISSLKKQIVKLQVKVARLNRTISGDCSSSSSMMRSNY